jgi:hypothetical protein
VWPLARVSSSSPSSRLIPIPITGQAAVDETGKVVPPDVAAERVATLMRSTRTAPLHGKREPVGALLTANLQLDGLKDEWISLTWAMYPEGETTPLYGDWLRTTAAYKLRPSTDHDSATVALWVPLPKSRGMYGVTLTASLRGLTLASADTPAFKA